MSGAGPGVDVDDLAPVGRRLATVDDLEVAEHPGALDEVHRALVAALDDLAGAVGADAGRR